MDITNNNNQSENYSKPEEKPSDRYRVKADMTLGEVLNTMYRGKSKTSLKKMLSSGLVLVNGNTIKNTDANVLAGDEVTIGKAQKMGLKSNKYLKLIYEDQDLLVIHKMPGVNTNATNKYDTNSVFHQLSEYVKQTNPKYTVFIVHRLDKETSGVLVFAKSMRIREALQEKWKDKKRIYIALVEGEVAKQTGSITSWLTETKDLRMISSQIKGQGKEAVTRFEVLQQNEKYSLLQVSLLTGRKNQIRVHMKDLGYPIAGDEKYGAKTNPLSRVCLHAKLLAFEHPVTGEFMSFETDTPDGFYKISKPQLIQTPKVR